MSELEITANAVQNLVERNFIWRHPSAARWEAALWAGSGIVAAVLLPFMTLIWGAALVWLWLCGVLGAGAYLFTQGSWIEIAGPCLLPLAALSIFAARRLSFLAYVGKRVIKEGGWSSARSPELGVALPAGVRPLEALGPAAEKAEEAGLLSSYQVIEDLGGPWREKRYLARHPSRPSRLLLGVLRSAPAAERRAFAAKALALRTLKSKALAAVLDSGVEGDDAFAAADLSGGDILSLADCLRSGGNFEIPWILDKGASWAEALAEVHGKGISGVFSPFNVFILKGGEARLAAFLGGLPAGGGASSSAFPDHAANGSGRGESSAAVLALSYLSPEALAGRPLDGRSDIFSLGTVLYELLAGRHPFLAAMESGEGLGDLLYRIANDPPFPPAAAGRMPPCAEPAIFKALQKDPARRYQSALDMAADLRECSASLRP